MEFLKMLFSDLILVCGLFSPFITVGIVELFAVKLRKETVEWILDFNGKIEISN